MTKPGVQNPHCEPWHSTIACWIGLRVPVVSDSLDRDDVRTIELMERLNARDDRPIANGPVLGGAGQDRACPAIPFGTADLGADQAAAAGGTRPETERRHPRRSQAVFRSRK